jgi:hypothetical protein
MRDRGGVLAAAPPLGVATLEVGERGAPVALADRLAHHPDGVHLGVGLGLAHGVGEALQAGVRYVLAGER